MDKEFTKDDLDRFFSRLETLASEHIAWATKLPKTLVVNPDIIGKLSRVEGFYQRPELEALVPAHSPVVRHFRLHFGVVELYEDWEEQFLHFE